MDLRRWGGGRPTLRNPHAPGWPRRGEQTEFEDKATEWAIVYRDRLLHKKYRRQSGQPEEVESVEKAVERYLRHRARTVEQNTLEADQTALAHMVAHLGPNAPVDGIETDELQAWFDARIDERYKASTLARYRGSMSKFFIWTKGPNPTEALELPEPEAGEARAWSDAELVEIRKAADRVGERHRLFLELGLATGGRVAELMALEWEDFDQAHRTVRFRRQLVREGSNEVKGLKGDKSRTALVLPEWWEFHRPGASGRIVKLRRPMAKILTAAGIKEPEILNHAMRHSYARICRERYHIPISVLKVYLGHTSEQITERFYGWMGRDVALEYGHSLVYQKA